MFNIDRKRKSLSQLLGQLAGDGVRAAEGELALARSELGEVVRRLLMGIVFGATAVGVLIVTVGILAHGAALALTPYMANAAYAYLSVGLTLAAIAIILFTIANRYLTKRLKPVGLIFKWFADISKTSVT